MAGAHHRPLWAWAVPRTLLPGFRPWGRACMPSARSSERETKGGFSQGGRECRGLAAGPGHVQCEHHSDALQRPPSASWAGERWACSERGALDLDTGVQKAPEACLARQQGQAGDGGSAALPWAPHQLLGADTKDRARCPPNGAGGSGGEQAGGEARG